MKYNRRQRRSIQRQLAAPMSGTTTPPAPARPSVDLFLGIDLAKPDTDDLSVVLSGVVLNDGRLSIRSIKYYPRAIPSHAENEEWKRDCNSRVKLLALIVFALAAAFVGIVVWFLFR